MYLAIVIPTFNRKSCLSNLLFDLSQQILKLSNIKILIVVVVDGSTDGTIEMLQNDYPLVRVIVGSGNWWYTRSINEGMKFSVESENVDFVLALNDDIRLDENFLIEIVNLIEVDSKRIINCISLVEGDEMKIFNSGVSKESWYGYLTYYRKSFSVFKPHEVTGLFPTKRINGRGLLIPRSILLKLDYFDDLFLQYKSDSDFGLRANSIGYKTYMCYDTIIYGKVEETSHDASFMKQRYWDFIKSFFNPYSRNYLKSLFRFNIRHKGFLRGSLFSLIEIGVKFRNQLTVKQ